MPDMAVTITLSAQDDASAALAKVREAMGQVGEATKDAGEKAGETRGAFDRIKEGMEEGFGLALGYTGFRDLRDIMEATIETVVGFNAELEGMSARLEILTGSVGQAAEALQSVKDVADQSPFDLKTIEVGEERLLRFNFSMEDATKVLKVATDAAAAGFGTVDSLTQSFGRLNEKTDLSTRGLMGLMQAGVPVFDILAKGFNVTTAEAENLVTKGLIPTKQGIDVLLAGMEQRAPEAAAKMADTFDGLTVRLKDAIALEVAAMGKPLFDVLESAIRDALAFIDSPDVKGALADFSSNVASTVHDVIDWFHQLGTAMSDPAVQQNLREAWANIHDIGADLWGLVRDFFIPQQKELNKSLGGEGVDSASGFAARIKILSGEIRDLTGAVKETVDKANQLGDALNDAKSSFDTCALVIHNGLIDALNAALTPLRQLLDMLNEFSTLADKTFHIKIDIPGQAGLQHFFDSIHQIDHLQTDKEARPGDGSVIGLANAVNAAGPQATPYIWGGAEGRTDYSTDAFTGGDCSGFVSWIYYKATGKKLPAYVADLVDNKVSTQIDASQARPGDLVAYNPHGAADEQHVGIYAGPGKMIDESTANGGGVQERDIRAGAQYYRVNGVDLGGGTSGSQSGGAIDSASDTEKMVRVAAAAHNIDPDIAVRVWKGEGSVSGAGAGDSGSSFGPFQLHMGGLAGGGNAGPGAGDDFMRATGLDPRDPANAQAATDWYLGQVSSTGTWSASHGAATAGVGPTQGIGGTYGPEPVVGQEGFIGPAPVTLSTADMAAKTAEPLVDTFDKLMRDTATKMTGIQTTENKSIASATTQYAPGGTADLAAEADAKKKLADLDRNKAIQDDATARKAAVAQEVQDDTDRENQRLAAEAVVYNRGLQDEATAHSRKLEDDQILVNQQLANVELHHQRDLQDAQTVHQQQLAMAATKHQQELQDAQTLVSQQLANVELLHQRSLQDAQIAPNEQLQAQAVLHSRTLENTEIQYQYQRDLSKATSDQQRAQITKAHDDNLENVAHQRQLQDAEIVYQQGLQSAALAKQRADQDAEIKYQNDQKAAQTVQQRADAEKESQYQMGLAATEVQYQRGLQDTEIQYQQGVAAQALVRSRALADEETAYNRGLEDKAAAHTAELAATAKAFAAQEKAKVDAVDKQLADEAFARQKQQVADDLAAKKASIAEEYATRVAAAVQTAAEQRAALKASADQTAADQVAAMTKALAGLNGAGDPIIAKMKADWAGVDTAMDTAAKDETGNLVKVQTATDATAAKADAAATKINTAVGSTNTAYAQSAGAISKSLGITDTAVETYANFTGQKWDVARTTLNDMVMQYGVGSQQISAAFGITDKAVEQYALDHHTDWEKARVDLNTAAVHAGEVLGTDGTDGTIPKAAKITTTAFDEMQKTAAKTSPLEQLQKAAQDLASQGLDPASKAARDLDTAIQEIKDKTVTVTTQFVTVGNATTSIASGIVGGNAASSGAIGGIGSSGTSSQGGDTSAASPSGQHIGESGPGGRYNNPATGQPYTHAAGGVTTGPVGGIFGEAGPEAIIPLGDYMLSHKSTAATPSIDYDKLAEALVHAMNKNGAFSVDVDQVHSGLLQKARRRGSLGLA